MRIIGGVHKGHRLLSPHTSHIRPTRDRIRESVFNILKHNPWSPTLNNTYVLDACCGTGAYGLEALSQGGDFCLFIDHSPHALSIAQKNASKLLQQNRTHFLQIDVRYPPKALIQANLVFLDPPYHTPIISETLCALSHNGWIATQGIIVVEANPYENIPPIPSFNLLDYRKYHNTVLLFLQYNTPQHVTPNPKPVKSDHTQNTLKTCSK